MNNTTNNIFLSAMLEYRAIACRQAEDIKMLQAEVSLTFCTVFN